jgi:UDP-N-acetylmuramoylalanine--D-glutamate ligase
VDQYLEREKSYLIVGGGLTGLSAARFLEKQKKPYRVFDTRSDESVLKEFKVLNTSIEAYAGSLPDFVLEHTTEIILSPGVSRSEGVIQTALESGIPVKSDISVFLEHTRAPVIGITGTNGKSTVTTMVGLAAQAANINVGVGGNLGVPALDLLDETRDMYVLELSSFQLESTDNPGLEVAAILNISQDHMDRHIDFNAYVDAKHKIYGEAKHAVYKLDDEWTEPKHTENMVCSVFGLEADSKYQGLQYVYQKESGALTANDRILISDKELLLPGLHNVENALASYAICAAANIPDVAVAKMLKSFSGLKHRCQIVGVFDSLTFINDSKSTNVGSVSAALRGFVDSFHSIVWIAGGVAKGADFSALEEIVAECVDRVILFGKDAKKIYESLSARSEVAMADSLEQAVNQAVNVAHPESLILFSPGCASFDMYKNFEHRGDAFVSIVEGMYQ